MTWRPCSLWRTHRCEPRRLAPLRTRAAPARQALGHSLGTGGATEALGALGAWGPHEHLGLRRARVSEAFPPALEAAAAALLADPPPDADAAARLDLRHQAVVTIDDPSTQGARAPRRRARVLGEG